MIIALILGVVVAGAVGGLVAYDRRTRARQLRDEADAEAFAAFLEADRDRALFAPWPTIPAPVVAITPGSRNGGIPVVRPVAHDAFDARTARLVVDPTLSAAEVTEMVQHVAPGAGSVASIVAVEADQRLCTPSELRAAEDAAHAEAAERAVAADRAFFARFDAVMNVALAGFRERTARADQWAAYQHAEHAHECEHCQRLLSENSDEYKLIRSLDDTGSIPVTELHAMLAAA